MKSKCLAVFLLFLAIPILSCGGGGSGNGTFSGGGNNRSGPVPLSWTNPTKNTDNTTLNNLEGCRIYYGTASRSYTRSIYVPITTPGANITYTVKNLPRGYTYYFAVTAVNTSGLDSAYSSEISKSLN